MNLNSSHMTPIDNTYPSCERTYAELRIYPKSLDPEVVTNMLGIEPSSTQKKGDIKINSLGRSCKTHRNGWFLSTEEVVVSKDLRPHLDWLLEQLNPIRKALIGVQGLEGMLMTVNCVWWSAGGQGGPTLWPKQMELLAELNLECGFEIAFFGPI